MTFMDKLEKKFGRYYIPDLTAKLLFIKVVTYLFIILQPDFILQYYQYEVFKDKYVTNILGLIIIPPIPYSHGLNILFAFFAFHIFWLCGKSLENAWGQWKFNFFVFVYFFSNLFIYLILVLLSNYHISISGVLLASEVASGLPSMLFLTMFLAFAKEFPDYEFLLFFILPVKVKFLAWLDYLIILLVFIAASGILKLVVVVSMLNWVLFLVPMYLTRAKNQARALDFERKVNPNPGGTFRKCAHCGVTENDGKHIEFRVSSVDGEEYCMDHIKPENRN